MASCNNGPKCFIIIMEEDTVTFLNANGGLTLARHLWCVSFSAIKGLKVKGYSHCLSTVVINMKEVLIVLPFMLFFFFFLYMKSSFFY